MIMIAHTPLPDLYPLPNLYPYSYTWPLNVDLDDITVALDLTILTGEFGAIGGISVKLSETGDILDDI